MEEVKTLSEILAAKSGIEEVHEVQFFDDPVPANSGRLSIGGIAIIQVLTAAVLVGCYFLAERFLPELFMVVDSFLKSYLLS